MERGKTLKGRVITTLIYPSQVKRMKKEKKRERRKREEKKKKNRKGELTIILTSSQSSLYGSLIS